MLLLCPGSGTRQPREDRYDAAAGIEWGPSPETCLGENQP